MRRLLVIGIGVGDPEYVTVQAVSALNRVDVFFVLDKGPAARDLELARQEILERYVAGHPYRTVTVTDPPRDRRAADYTGAVDDWRNERALRLEQVISAELPEHGVGGFLVWGDPSLYDGTLRVIEAILDRGELALEYDVLPGVSTIHALAARHRVTLNRVAGAVHVTTGRRLGAHGLPDGADDVVVMLDTELACAKLPEQDLEIYWGAYLGSADEILVSGRLGDVIGEIERVRQEARDRKGWIMDSYLLRRPAAPGD